MDDLTFASWLRVVLIGSTLLVTLMLIVQSVRAWKHLSIGQKLWATGTICALLYICDAAREAVEVDLEFRFRLFLWAAAVVAYYAYLLEPNRSKMRRFGGGVFDSPRSL